MTRTAPTGLPGLPRSLLLWFAALAVALAGCGGGFSGGAKAAESPAYRASYPAGAPMREEGAATEAETSFDGDEAVTGAYVAQRAPAPAPPPPPPAATGAPAPDRARPDVPAPQPGAPADPGGPTPSDPQKLAGPLLIYSATITLAVFEARKTLDEAEKLAKELGGYLVRRNDHSITVRVPAGRFDAGLDRFVKLGDLLAREVSARDVTDEFFDTQTRLRNAEVVRERLEQLLQKAGKVEEALAVERELARVSETIERLKGRMKLLKELIAFSTITVVLQPRPQENVGSTVRMPFDWLGGLGLGSLLSL